jgi:hypothetical protein
LGQWISHGLGCAKTKALSKHQLKKGPDMLKKMVVGLTVIQVILASQALAQKPTQEGAGKDLPIAERAARWTLEFNPEYYVWKEFKDNGQRWLTESGPRFVFGVSEMPVKDRGWLFGAQGKVYYGEVDYDGRLQDGTPDGTPYKSTTVYFGGVFEPQLVYRKPFNKSRYAFDTTVGIGFEGWVRDLSSDTDIHGYVENWYTFYLRGGIAVQAPHQKGWTAGAGFKLPFYTIEEVDMTRNFGMMTTLYPQMMISPYGFLGYRFTKGFSLQATFDSFWFNKSSYDRSGSHQPESQRWSVGLSAQLHF